MYTIFIWCFHFEEMMYEQLRDFQEFMEFGMKKKTTGNDCSSSLEIFDAIRQEIAMECENPNKNMLELPKKVGIHGISAR